MFALLTLPFTAISQEDILVDTLTRNMILYAPEDLPENSPVMISLHGYNQDAAYQQGQAQWEPIADTANFVVVYPDGINKAWDISGDSDIKFILTIIDTLYNRYKIDTNRVYLSGFSMGGMMTFYTATKIADKIAAFAPVSGYLMAGANTNTSRPIPIFYTHGTTDEVVSYKGVQDCIDAWVERNVCPANPVVSDPYPSDKTRSIASLKYYGPGNGGADIALLTLEGKGHWWSMDVASGVSTSEEIWKFVKKYSLADTPPSIELTKATLKGFSYIEGSGSSETKEFTVAGSMLTNDIVVDAAENYELSLSTTIDYTSSITLSQVSGTVNETAFVTRLKEGLPVGIYDENITISSNGANNRIVQLNGEVKSEVIDGVQSQTSTATVVSQEFFNISGQRIANTNNIEGIYIVRKLMSNGTYITEKHLKKLK